jgi:spermidine synthase
VSFVVALVVVMLSGFVSLSYEILWIRVFSFATGSTPTIFGLLLGVYLAGLAAGALASRSAVVSASRRSAYYQLRVVAAALGAAALAGFAVVPGLAWLGAHGAWRLGMVLVLLAATMFGVVMPVVSHLGIAPEEAVGARLSYLYLASILGSTFGCLITGFVLTDVWTVAEIARALALTGLGLAAAVAVSAERRSAPRSRGRAVRIGGVLALSASAAWLVLAATQPLFDRLYERLLYKEAFRDHARFSEVVETRSDIIAITPDAEVFGGGAYDGYISTDLVNDRNGIVRAYALAALHPHPSRVLEIGLSAGSWARVLTQLPGVEHLTSVEINPGYMPIIARHAVVSGLLRDPRFEVVIDDGRRWLGRHPEERFDAIVMNMTFHGRAHATNLLSTEFMQLARRHLLPGGVFYFNTTWSPDAAKTALSLYPYGLRCLNFIAVSDTPISFDAGRWSALLRGLRLGDGRLAFDASDPRAAARLDALLALPGSLGRPPAAYGLETRASLLARITNADVITDDNMLSEWRGTALGRPALSY